MRHETWDMKIMKHGIWDMKHETWNMKYETWNMRHETWNVFAFSHYISIEGFSFHETNWRSERHLKSVITVYDELPTEYHQTLYTFPAFSRPKTTTGWLFGIAQFAGAWIRKCKCLTLWYCFDTLFIGIRRIIGLPHDNESGEDHGHNNWNYDSHHKRARRISTKIIVKAARMVVWWRVAVPPNHTSIIDRHDPCLS